MKLKAFAFRDMKADNFHAPFFVATETHARRLSEQLVQNPDSELGKYTNDFMLYEIGEYETSTGTLSGKIPSEIASAISFKPKPDSRQITIPGTEAN